MAVWFGFNPPFVNRTAVLPFQTDDRLIKNDLLQLLLTSPGERVMRPEFGTALKGFMFEQLTDSDVEALRQSILFSIERFEPRVSVVTLHIDRDDGNNLIKIVLLTKLVSDQNKILEVQLNLNESESGI